jgi:hypothetical protein
MRTDPINYLATTGKVDLEIKEAKSEARSIPGQTMKTRTRTRRRKRTRRRAEIRHQQPITATM